MNQATADDPEKRPAQPTTKDAAYADYLIQNQNSFRSTLVQLPYRTHLKCLGLGRTLEIGCGAGRNLKALRPESVGIDHNDQVVNACVKWGFNASTTQDFLSARTTHLNTFDSILLSHVAEHMSSAELSSLLRQYGEFLKPGGRIVVICPQELGYQSDATHVQFMDFEALKSSLRVAEFKVQRQYSFPFPRFAGKVFRHNEFVVIGVK